MPPSGRPLLNTPTKVFARFSDEGRQPEFFYCQTNTSVVEYRFCKPKEGIAELSGPMRTLDPIQSSM